MVEKYFRELEILSAAAPSQNYVTESGTITLKLNQNIAATKFMNYLPYQKLGASRFLTFKGYLTVVSNMAACTSASIKSIDYDQLIEHIKNKTYLVDVREKQELCDTGTLPNSVNIPVGEVGAALQLPDDEYVTHYEANKPRLDQEIIFSCRSGKRSLMAAEIAAKLGFQK